MLVKMETTTIKPEPKENQIQLFKNPATVASLTYLQEKLDNMQYELDSRDEDIAILSENKIQMTEFITKILIDKVKNILHYDIKRFIWLQAKVERESIALRNHENKLQLGEYVNYRVGTHYNQRWVEGIRFENLER